MFVVQVISRLRLVRNKKFEKILNLYKCLYRPYLNQQFLPKNNRDFSLGTFEKHHFGELFPSNRRHFVFSQQKLLIELRAIATLLQIKNLFEFFVSDKPTPGNHLHHGHNASVLVPY